jgi:hypothetical protein
VRRVSADYGTLSYHASEYLFATCWSTIIDETV